MLVGIFSKQFLNKNQTQIMMVCDVEQTHLHPPLCRLIMCKADSLSNWSLVVYMSFKVVYSEAFEIRIVLVLHVMNTNESWT